MFQAEIGIASGKVPTFGVLLCVSASLPVIDRLQELTVNGLVGVFNVQAS